MSENQTRTSALSVDFDQLVCNANLNNREVDPAAVHQFAVNFLLIGQIGGIGVEKVRTGGLTGMFSKARYSVRYGFHRYHAFKLLREEGLDAEVLRPHFDLDKITSKRYIKLEDNRLYYTGKIDVEVHKSSAHENELRRASENLVRKDYSPIEEAKIFQDMKENHKMSSEAISIYFGGKYTPNQVSDRLWLLKLPADVQDKIHSGEWAISKAYDLYNGDGQLKQKRAASSFTARNKRTFNNALKAIEAGKLDGDFEFLTGMSEEQLAAVKHILRWCRGEEPGVFNKEVEMGASIDPAASEMAVDAKITSDAEVEQK